jgi:hypothetical protein
LKVPKIIANIARFGLAISLLSSASHSTEAEVTASKTADRLIIEKSARTMSLMSVDKVA